MSPAVDGLPESPRRRPLPNPWSDGSLEQPLPNDADPLEDYKFARGSVPEVLELASLADSKRETLRRRHGWVCRARVQHSALEA